MNSRIRDLQRMLETVAEPFSADVEIETTNGQHLRVILTLGPRCGCVIASMTPSDRWHADQNVRADARRLLRRLTTEVHP